MILAINLNLKPALNVILLLFKMQIILGLLNFHSSITKMADLYTEGLQTEYWNFLQKHNQIINARAMGRTSPGGKKMYSSLGLQSVSWSLAEFRHNKILQSPRENYFNVCRQHKKSEIS